MSELPGDHKSLCFYLNSLSEAAIFVDSQARILFANSAAEKFLEVPLKNGTVQLSTLFSPGKNDNFWKVFQSLFENAQSGKSEQSRISVEICIRDKCVHMHGHLTVLSFAPGETCAVIVLPVLGMGIVSESGYAQGAASQTSRSEFIGMAVHDLRTPLHKITLACEVLDSENISAERRKSFIQMIRRASAGMGDLINDLLDLTKIESGKITLKKEKLAVAEYLANICQENKLLAQEKDINFHWSLAQGLGSIELDPKRIGQVLNNLLSNAFKFSAPHTEVIVDAKTFEGGIEVSVIDHGPGIATEEIPKLFDAFVQSKNRPTGGEQSTGLGLAISKKIIELHGGLIGVNSKEGAGSTFYFTIPQAKSE